MPTQKFNSAVNFKLYKVIVPTLIGLGVVFVMFWHELYPKPKITNLAEQTTINYHEGDTLWLTNKAALYSTQELLAVNVKQLLPQAPADAVLLVNETPAFRVIALSDSSLQCVALQNVEIQGGESFAIPGKKLHAPNVGDVIRRIGFSWHLVAFVLLAILLMLGRDIGYIARLRILSEGELSWLQCLRVIILWEFTSTITPSAVGGTGVAIVYVNKEGLSIGKSSAIVMATSLLDEIYFVVMFPLLLLVIPNGALFDISSSIVTGLFALTLTGYFIKLAWVLLLIYGMFVNPNGLRWIIINFFSLPLLRRWRQGAVKAGRDVVISAKELKQKSLWFWAKAFGTTFLSWTSRYWVINALFLAFFVVNDHLLIFARQLVMWIMMLVSPTPGASGFAEFVFKEFLGDFIPSVGLIVIIALLWRFISYYFYLIFGIIVVPLWIKQKFHKTKPEE